MRFRRLLRLFVSVKDEVDDEIRFHLEMRAREMEEAAGLTKEAARAEAERQFGDIERVRRETMEQEGRRRESVARASFWDGLRQDLIQGLRVLRQSPAFSALVVFTLAIAIGAGTAIFSVVSGVLLRPLPLDRPDRLVRIWTRNAAAGLDHAAVSVPDFEDWSKPNAFAAGMAAYTQLASGLTLTGAGDPVRLNTTYVSSGFFETLGIHAERGRVFGPDEQRPGQDQVVVLSHGAWLRYFGGDPAIVGRSVLLDGRSFTVLGVLPAQVRFPDDTTEALAPLSLVPETAIPRLRFVRWLSVIARLRPGIGLQQAQSKMDAVARSLEAQYPDANAGWGLTTVAPLRETIVGDARRGLLILLGAVGLLLAIACVNVANLLLARTVVRQRELAVRAALGAGRARIVRQLLAESLVLSCCGGGLGILLAACCTDALVALSGRALPRAAEVTIDLRVLGFAVLLALLTGIAAGVIPALRGTEAGAMGALRESTSSMSRRSGRLRDGLVAAEVALALVLVVGAGLLTKSFLRLAQVDPGFEAQHALVARFTIPMDRYPHERALALYDELIARVRQVPGVTAAGAIKEVPLRGSGELYSYSVPGRAEPRAGEEPRADFSPVSPGYFRAMGIELLAGREIDDRDTEKSEYVVVINQAMSRAAFGGESPIGRAVNIGKNRLRIVGLVHDVHTDRLDAAPRPAMFVPQRQVLRAVVSLVARTQGDPAALLPAVREAIRGVDPALPLTELAPLTQVVADTVSAPRFLTILLAIFGGIALLLAVVGLYGVVATAVRQRRREIGIRLALGARPAAVVRRTLSRSMVPVAIGLAMGLGAAGALTSLLGTVLYGVRSLDPPTFALGLILLCTVALLAAWLPARAAAGVDVIEVLREE
jgi:predicted permease